MISISNVGIGGFRGGLEVPPEWNYGGGWTPLYFYKFITPKAFDLEKVSYDHQQVGQAEKNGDAPKEACLNFGQQCFI